MNETRDQSQIEREDEQGRYVGAKRIPMDPHAVEGGRVEQGRVDDPNEAWTTPDSPVTSTKESEQ